MADTIDYKACKRCSGDRSLSDYYYSIVKGNKYYATVCNVCKAQIHSEMTDEEKAAYIKKRKEQYQNRKDPVKVQNKSWRDKNKVKYLEYKIRYKIENKEAINQRNKQYVERNREVIKQKVKMYWDKDRSELNAAVRERRKNRTPEQLEKERIYRKQYKEKNFEILRIKAKERRDKNKHKKREYHHNRYRTDINYKLLHNLRSRVKNAVRFKLKANKTIDLIGCSMSFLKNHIEKQFTEGMTWEIFMTGAIHVDHKIPCAKFDLSKPEEQNKCFHWSNLQPLWAIDNLIKRDKMLPKYA